MLSDFLEDLLITKRWEGGGSTFLHYDTKNTKTVQRGRLNLSLFFFFQPLQPFKPTTGECWSHVMSVCACVCAHVLAAALNEQSGMRQSFLCVQQQTPELQSWSGSVCLEA